MFMSPALVMQLNSLKTLCSLVPRLHSPVFFSHRGKKSWGVEPGNEASPLRVCTGNRKANRCMPTDDGHLTLFRSMWPYYHFFMHLVPGFFADLLLQLIGKKPR